VETEVLLYIKGLPALPYRFLALTDVLADALMVAYLSTVDAYR